MLLHLAPLGSVAPTYVCCAVTGLSLPLVLHAQTPASQCVMLASAVSSTALGAMAAVEGFKFEQTLTGFKWLGNIAKARQAQGFKVLFAFEEAIGFMFPDVGMVSGGVEG